jgi:hypothetical protein
VWLVGGCYNFVWAHCTLGEGRTPAMAAEMTDHRWSTEELLRYPVPPAELPPGGAGGSRGGCWKQSVQPDHGSLWSYHLWRNFGEFTFYALG